LHCSDNWRKPGSSPLSESRLSSPRSDYFARWRELSRRDKNQLIALMMLLPVVHLALALFRYGRVRSWLARLSDHRKPTICTAQSIASAQRLAELAAIAGRRGAVEASCLRQALVVWWWLRRRGLSPQLRIGTLGSGDTFAAHAWVELESVALAQRELQHRPFAGV
jgi:hypothetical protein